MYIAHDSNTVNEFEGGQGVHAYRHVAIAVETYQFLVEFAERNNAHPKGYQWASFLTTEPAAIEVFAANEDLLRYRVYLIAPSGALDAASAQMKLLTNIDLIDHPSATAGYLYTTLEGAMILHVGIPHEQLPAGFIADSKRTPIYANASPLSIRSVEDMPRVF
jgi:hypothetical protein